jgi:hypothetical protein
VFAGLCPVFNAKTQRRKGAKNFPEEAVGHITQMAIICSLSNTVPTASIDAYEFGWVGAVTHQAVWMNVSLWGGTRRPAIVSALSV